MSYRDLFNNLLGCLVFLSTPVVSVSADTFVCEHGFCVMEAHDVLNNVIVRNGGILLLQGTIVTGNIEIEERGILAASGAKITGNVRGRDAFLVDLTSCQISGNVELRRTAGVLLLFELLLPSVDLLSCRVDGNVKVSDSDVNFLIIVGNHIRGQLELQRNLSIVPIAVDNNVITMSDGTRTKSGRNEKTRTGINSEAAAPTIGNGP